MGLSLGWICLFSARRFAFAQPERWILPVAVLGSSLRNSMERGCLPGGRGGFHSEACSVAASASSPDRRRRPWSWSGRRHRSRRSPPPLQHRGCCTSVYLHLEGADVDAADLEHVVAAPAVGIAAVVVAQVFVAAGWSAWKVCVGNFSRLPQYISAAEGPGYRARPARRSRPRRRSRRTAARCGSPPPASRWCRSALGPVGQEDVQHLGAADAVDDDDAEARSKRSADLGRAAPRRRTMPGAARSPRPGGCACASMPAYPVGAPNTVGLGPGAPAIPPVSANTASGVGRSAAASSRPLQTESSGIAQP